MLGYKKKDKLNFNMVRVKVKSLLGCVENNFLQLEGILKFITDWNIKVKFLKWYILGRPSKCDAMFCMVKY